MTEAELIAFEDIIKQTTLENIDNGLLTAVEMIRIAARKGALMTLNQLADSIEESVYKNHHPRRLGETVEGFQETLRSPLDHD